MPWAFYALTEFLLADDGKEFFYYVNISIMEIANMSILECIYKTKIISFILEKRGIHRIKFVLGKVKVWLLLKQLSS